MRGVVAAGFFDGVHLGHRGILVGADCALTFRNHPIAVLRPDLAPPLLMSYEEREAAIRSCGVKEVVALDFTPALAATSAEEFARKWLADAATVRCGGNWRFGAGGRGDANLLRAMGVHVEVAPYSMFGGSRISSTRIREAIAEGDMPFAAGMLGRPWTVTGEVFPGKGLGRGLGFPTLNIRPDAALQRPPRGVYEVEMCSRRAVANWGVAPTMGGDAWREGVLEVHFDGAPPSDAPAPGGRAKVTILRFIRPERRFDSVDELKAAMAADCAAVFGIMTNCEVLEKGKTH